MQICSTVEAKLCRNLLFELRQALAVTVLVMSGFTSACRTNSFCFNIYRGSEYIHCDRLQMAGVPVAQSLRF